jgi:transcriptional regulator with GAF, ATPase, and Fis domain
LAVSTLLQQQKDAATVLQLALEPLLALASADIGRAFLFDDTLRNLRQCAVFPRMTAEAPETALDLGTAGANHHGPVSPLVYCLQRNEAISLDDPYHYTGFECSAIYQSDQRLQSHPDGDFVGLQTGPLLAIPLRDYSNHAVGALMLHRMVKEGEKSPVPFSAQTLSDVVRYARHTASAVTGVRLSAASDASNPEQGKHDDKRLAAFNDIVGASAPMRSAIYLAARAAATDATVLLCGETGTGKDLFASALHRASDRANGPFVVQNCAAIPETMLEAELFGWEKGAFSGAHTSNIGLFARADGGTLFLDEIGDLPLSLQPKLLRVLQNGLVRPLGGQKERSINIRIIAATHRDLETHVATGQFRADLFYRIAVFPIHLAPLRDRPEDILPLARHFVSGYCAQMRLSIQDIAPDALALLQAHPWPGNSRELRNIIERAMVLADAQAPWLTLPTELCSGLQPVPDAPNHPAASTNKEAPPDWWSDLTEMSLKNAVEAIERRLIERQLILTAGNIQDAALRLGVPRRTLSHKVNRYGISVEKRSPEPL